MQPQPQRIREHEYLYTRRSGAHRRCMGQSTPTSLQVVDMQQYQYEKVSNRHEDKPDSASRVGPLSQLTVLEPAPSRIH